ncbi:CPBP family intramembrane metalloprotease [Mycobacterium sp. TNTM28]|uniref:CPBP family intramembrane metalloprotease n=1 Tax=[Mycobacterium] fortunisiensis TaxID=2600579 RepID=A0ABS6KNL6_9MYCO|nr:type II CAAX endopeptidase family protein [[Mycobacterium] fortunisiensis]MBU9765163.1 CPBP family intramembrane metalloprotease [[Mycobacterium] fortunisiensis]
MDAVAHPSTGTSRPTHRWGLGAFVLVEVVYLLASAAFSVFAPAGAPPAWLITLAIGVPTLVAAALAVGIARWRGNGARLDFRWQWSWRAIGIGLAFGVGGLFITLPAALLYQSIVGPDATSAVGGIFRDVRTGWPVAVVVLLLVAVIAPICEEVIFRGLLWGALEQRWGRVMAATVSTLVFALAHLEPQRAPLLLVVAIPIALARLYSGSLWGGIIAHQVTNLLPGIVLMFGLVGLLPAG